MSTLDYWLVTSTPKTYPALHGPPTTHAEPRRARACLYVEHGAATAKARTSQQLRNRPRTCRFSTFSRSSRVAITGALLFQIRFFESTRIAEEKSARIPAPVGPGDHPWCHGDRIALRRCGSGSPQVARDGSSGQCDQVSPAGELQQRCAKLLART